MPERLFHISNIISNLDNVYDQEETKENHEKSRTARVDRKSFNEIAGKQKRGT